MVEPDGVVEVVCVVDMVGVVAVTVVGSELEVDVVVVGSFS